MREQGSNPLERIREYYATKESRIGYALLLDGTKHFGYYEEGQKLSMREAVRQMTTKVGETLREKDLLKGSKVLDAGCGEGGPGMQLEEEFGYEVVGIDLQEYSLRKAKRKVPEGKYIEGNYQDLMFPNNHFDGVFTLETLVHAPDHMATLKEFHRVMKPGGKIALFEYSLPKRKDMSEVEKRAFDTIIEGSAMQSLPKFTHGKFPDIMQEAGFENPQVEDITARITPMLRRFWQLGILPYQFFRLLGLEKKFVNTTAGVKLYEHRDIFRYNIVTANK